MKKCKRCVEPFAPNDEDYCSECSEIVALEKVLSEATSRAEVLREALKEATAGWDEQRARAERAEGLLMKVWRDISENQDSEHVLLPWPLYQDIKDWHKFNSPI